MAGSKSIYNSYGLFSYGPHTHVRTSIFVHVCAHEARAAGTRGHAYVHAQGPCPCLHRCLYTCLCSCMHAGLYTCTYTCLCYDCGTPKDSLGDCCMAIQIPTHTLICVRMRVRMPSDTQERWWITRITALCTHCLCSHGLCNHGLCSYGRNGGLG